MNHVSAPMALTSSAFLSLSAVASDPWTHFRAKSRSQNLTLQLILANAPDSSHEKFWRELAGAGRGS